MIINCTYKFVNNKLRNSLNILLSPLILISYNNQWKTATIKLNLNRKNKEVLIKQA